jgi:hypothetical protein
MQKPNLEAHSDFLWSAAVVLFFATLSALALYAATAFEQPELFK